MGFGALQNTGAIPDEPAQQILDKMASLESKRLPIEPVWEDVKDYVLPSRAKMNEDGSPNYEESNKIYDGTPINALKTLVDGLQGNLMSPSLTWFKLRMEDKRAQEITGVMDWLDAVESYLYSVFNRSNFYDTAGQFLEDGASFGTASMGIEEDLTTGKIVFTPWQPEEIFVDEDRYGKVDTIFRKFYKSGRNVLDQFKVKDEALRANIEKNPYEMYECVHAILPTKDLKGIVSVSKDHNWGSIYILSATGDIVHKGGYKDFPSVVWRWRKNSSEVYGRSPSIDSMRDIKKLNQMSKSLLQASQFSAQPMWNIPSEMKGRAKIRPGARNYYDSIDRVITPSNSGINYPVGVDREDRVKKDIEDAFSVEFFLMLSRSEREMTAQEVIERQGEKASILGTTIGRISSEMLDPIIDRVFMIEYEAGRLPPPPDELIESGANITTEYQGPLAQAQRKYHRTQGITQSLQAIAPLAQFSPSVMDNFDFDVLAVNLANEFGMPQAGIMDKEAVAQKRETRMQQQQALTQQAKQTEDLEKFGKMTKAPEPGSPLDTYNQQQTPAQQQGVV